MNIETEYIKSLLSKYYSGDSTLDEERLIREYFAGAATDPELETDRMVFAAMAETVKAPDSLREAVEKHVEQESVKEIKKRLRPRYGRIAAAAAVLLAAVTVSVHYLGRPSEPTLTPEEAREHTVMALTLLTKTMKKGYTAVENSARTASTTIETAENTINKL